MKSTCAERRLGVDPVEKVGQRVGNCNTRISWASSKLRYCGSTQRIELIFLAFAIRGVFQHNRWKPDTVGLGQVHLTTSYSTALVSIGSTLLAAPTDAEPMVRIHLPPAASQVQT